MVDTSIAMGYRPVQLDNPMNQLAQLLQIQQAQKQGQVADLSIQTAQRGFEEQNKLRDYFANNDPKGANFARGLYGISPDKGMAYDKALFDRQKDQAEINSKNASTDKTLAEVLNQQLATFRTIVPSITTPEAAGQYSAAMFDHPVLGKFAAMFGTKDEAIKRNMDAFTRDPRGWQVASAGVSADKLLESLKGMRQNVNLGGTNQGETINYYGEAVPGQTTLTPITQSADNEATNATSSANNAATNATSSANNSATVGASLTNNAATIANDARTANLTDARTRSEGALNRGVTVAGQDKTDARARELNQITAANKPLTEGQAKSALFGSRMQMSNQIFDTLEKAGTTTSTPGMNTGYGVGSVINALSGADQQQLMQAKRDFLNAALRRESGAVIGESEFANGEKQYFPQAGDTKQVITQKRANREAAMRGVLVDVPAGRRAEIVQEITGAAPGAPSSAAAARLLPTLPPADSSNRGKRARDTETGKVYKSNGTAWVEE